MTIMIMFYRNVMSNTSEQVYNGEEVEYKERGCR